MASKKSCVRFSIVSELHENVPIGWDVVATRLCMETLPMSAREAASLMDVHRKNTKPLQEVLSWETERVV